MQGVGIEDGIFFGDGTLGRGAFLLLAVTDFGGDRVHQPILRSQKLLQLVGGAQRNLGHGDAGICLQGEFCGECSVLFKRPVQLLAALQLLGQIFIGQPGKIVFGNGRRGRIQRQPEAELLMGLGIGGVDHLFGHGQAAGAHGVAHGAGADGCFVRFVTGQRLGLHEIIVGAVIGHIHRKLSPFVCGQGGHLHGFTVQLHIQIKGHTGQRLIGISICFGDRQCAALGDFRCAAGPYRSGIAAVNHQTLRSLTGGESIQCLRFQKAQILHQLCSGQ